MLGILSMLGCVHPSPGHGADRPFTPVGPSDNAEMQVSHAIHEVSGTMGQPAQDDWTGERARQLGERPSSEQHLVAASLPSPGGGPLSPAGGQVSPWATLGSLSSNMKLVLKSIAVGVLATLFSGLVVLVPFVLFKGGAAQSGNAQTATARSATPPAFPDLPTEGPFLAYVPTLASFVHPLSTTQDGLAAQAAALGQYAPPTRGANTTEPSAGGKGCGSEHRNDLREPPGSDTFAEKDPPSAGDSLRDDDLLREYGGRGNATNLDSIQTTASFEPRVSPASKEFTYQREFSTEDDPAEGGVFQQILEQNIQLRAADCGSAAG
jgi:hypothetical protein